MQNMQKLQRKRAKDVGDIEDGMANLTSLSDEKLYSLCRLYGEHARMWRQKFIGLLPEVYRRKLYEKKVFSSIFHFAKVLAGLSERQVDEVLHLEKRFDKTPMLKSMLVNGEVSVNKLRRVVSVAKPGNEEFWAGQVKILSKNAIETLVRDAKQTNNDLQNQIFGEQFMPGHHSGQRSKFAQAAGLSQQSSTNALNLSPEVQQKLFELQEKGIDINELILEFLKKREEEIALEKEYLALVEEYKSPIVNQTRTHRPAISVATKRLLKKEHGTKCSVPTCSKPAQIIHHAQRFALVKNHSPYFLAPLCKEHHEIAHSIDIKVQEKRWRHRVLNKL